jgi:hypothetical protein
MMVERPVITLAIQNTELLIYGLCFGAKREDSRQIYPITPIVSCFRE